MKFYEKWQGSACANGYTGRKDTVMTKKEWAVLKSYESSSKENLYQAYKSFSKEKAEAWENCKRLCKQYNGHDLRILGANTFFFSAGFAFTDEDGNKCLMYITHSDNKKIIVARRKENGHG